MADSGTEPGWEQVTKLTGHTDVVESVCWSPEGSRLASAGGRDETVRVWVQQGAIGLSKPASGEIGLRRPGNR